MFCIRDPVFPPQAKGAPPAPSLTLISTAFFVRLNLDGNGLDPWPPPVLSQCCVCFPLNFLDLGMRRDLIVVLEVVARCLANALDALAQKQS